MKALALLASLTLLATPFARGEDPATFSVGGLSFQRPTEWQWVPVTSAMRKAQLKVPGAEGKDAAEITFFHFGGGQGGDLQANAQRWLRQFESKEGASKVDWKEMGGRKVAVVSTEGTFQSGMPGGPTTPMPNYALLGAIVDHPDGNVFVKMTGPVETVKAAQRKFMDFVTAAATGGKKAQ